MKISRRKFLVAGPLAGAAIASASGLAAAQSGLAKAGSAGPVKNIMSYAAFSREVKTEFVFWGRDGIRAIARLDVVEDLMAATRSRTQLGGENFILKFSGLSEWPPKQATFRVEHATLGEFHLFVTESSADANLRKTYIAVVNNLD